MFRDMAGKAESVEKRRGRGGSLDGTSPAFLIDSADGGIDAVSCALASADGVGDVSADVTQRVLAKQLDVPGGRWELLIQLRGQRWAILTHSVSETDDWHRGAAALAGQLKRRVIAASDGGDEDEDGRFLLTDADGRIAIEYVSHGEPFSLKDVEAKSPLVGDYKEHQALLWATRFTSDRHDEDWWRGQPAMKAIDALLREFDAYLPDVAVETENGRVVLDIYPKKLHSAAAIVRIDVIAYGQRGKTRALSQDADRELAAAIKDFDPAGVAAALRAGADPRRLPGASGDAVEEAMRSIPFSATPLPDKLAVLDLLVAAGAGANAGAPADPDARADWWRQRRRDLLTSIYRKQWTINGDEPELELPASTIGQDLPVTVEPRTFGRWTHEERRDQAATVLKAAGFVRVGEFAVLERPELRMLVLHHGGIRAFATINKFGSRPWLEIIRWHDDGSTLAVLNPNTPHEPFVETARHRKVVQPRWGVNKLIKFMRNEPPRAGGAVEPVEPKDFKRYFQQYYGELLAAARQR